MRYRVPFRPADRGVSPRQLIASLLAVLMLIVAPRAADAAPGSEPARSGKGVTVAVIGDSLGDGVWSGFSLMWRNKPECKVVRRSKIGAGMTRTDFPRWQQDLAAELAAESVDVAVLMFGLNDQTGIRDEHRRGFLFRTEGWKQLYQARIESLVRDLVQRKVVVVWLGLPVMRSSELNAGARWINGLVEEKLKALGVVYVPLERDFANPDGEFQPYLQDEASQRSRQIRLEDGIHFTHYGYELIAAKARAAIRQALLARDPGLQDAFAC
jgi:hypothetical protein